MTLFDVAIAFAFANELRAAVSALLQNSVPRHFSDISQAYQLFIVASSLKVHHLTTVILLSEIFMRSACEMFVAHKESIYLKI